MGLIEKKDEKDYVEGVEVIGRSEPGSDEIDPDLIVEKEDMEGRYGPDPDLMDDDEGDVPDPDPFDDDAQDAGADDGEGAPEREAEPEQEAGLPAGDEIDPDRELPLGEDDADADAPRSRKALYIVGGAAALIVAALIGFFLGGGSFGAKGVGSATLTEAQLGDTVATWTYNGATHNVTAREAIESQYSLDAVKDEDGTYAAPSAESILAQVRNEVVAADAQARGIDVSDEELADYAMAALGTSDFETIAQQYHVSEDQAKDIVRQQTLIQKLYNEVVPAVATLPQAPSEPADGASDTATKEYADYIIDLAGDEWNADKGVWADADGAIAQALSGQDFNGKTATYAQAQAAYQAAYQQYAVDASDAGATWSQYVNNLFAQANVDLYGVLA